jgi:uncharacterized protein (DUF488 family)
MESNRGHPQPRPSPIFTIGHSARTVSELTGLLRQVSVDLLVEVRSVPRSRADPQFNADVLPASLAATGISYRHLAALGVCAGGGKTRHHCKTHSGETRPFAIMRIMRRPKRSGID